MGGGLSNTVPVSSVKKHALPFCEKFLFLSTVIFLLKKIHFVYNFFINLKFTRSFKEMDFCFLLVHLENVIFVV